jgi:hypothetical protein
MMMYFSYGHGHAAMGGEGGPDGHGLLFVVNQAYTAKRFVSQVK